MKQNAWRILGAIAALGMAAVCIVALAMGGCGCMIECTSGMVPMKCHWTFTAIPYVGAVGVVSALLAMMARSLEGRRIGAAATCVSALACILISSPAGIGVCAAAEMSCVTCAHITWIICAIVIIVSIVQIAKANPRAMDMPKMRL